MSSKASSSEKVSSSEKAAVEILKGAGGLKKVILRDFSGYSAEVSLYGGQVTSWKNKRGEELLFVSSKRPFDDLVEELIPSQVELSAYKPPKPIRGGIPLCFPQFSNNGSLEQHGFARNRFWNIDPSPPPLPTNSSDKTFVDLILSPKDLLPNDKTFWPHSFECRLRVALRLTGELLLTSRIRNINTDGKPFTFSFAYHTYFSVSDISEVRVEGLETTDYLDNLKNKELFTEQGDALTFESEVDKVYLSAPTKISILDHAKKQTFVIQKEGLPDVAVWNPWDKKAKALGDFGYNEYMSMLCVSPAAVETPITLKPGEEWTGRQKVCVVPSSYCSGQLDPQRVIRGN